MQSIKSNRLSRRQAIQVGVAAAAGVVAPAIISSRGFAAEPTPLRFGIANPLEGECAQWGVPIVRAAQMWADEHNAAGGIMCGDGLRHKIDFKAYTNVCFFPNEELKAFRSAILQDNRQYMFQTYTPACRKAVARLVTEKQVLTNSYGGGYMAKEFPFLLGGITGSPTAFLGLVAHVFEKHPDAKRVALLFSDNSYGLVGRAYCAAGCAPYVASGKANVVYNSVFDPNTTDYFPLLGEVLKTKPDAIFFADLPPGKQALLLQTAQQLGYKGIWMSHSWDLQPIAQRVDLADLEGRLYCGFGVDASEPTYSKRAYAMYQSYVSKYGQGEWIGFAGLTYSAMTTLEQAFAQSKSTEPKSVMDTLYGIKVLDHPIYGKSTWSGADVFGVDHHLLTPTPKYVLKKGTFALSGVTQDANWWAENKLAALPVLKSNGAME